MFIRFNVKNFMSFSAADSGKTREFSMIASDDTDDKRFHIYDDGHLRLLKFAAVYGANASGKSNLVKAMDFMKTMIVGDIQEGYMGWYCKSDIQNKNLESYFELELMIDNHYYAYGFEMILNQSKIVSEWLLELTEDNEEKMIFSRDVTKQQYVLGDCFKNEPLLQKLNVYAEDIREDETILFLSVMNRNKNCLYRDFSEALVLQKVFHWIKYNLNIHYPDKPSPNYFYFADQEKMDEIVRVVSAFDTGIEGYEISDISFDRVLRELPVKLVHKIVLQLEQKCAALKNRRNENEFGSKCKDVDGIIVRSNRSFLIFEINAEDQVCCKTIQFSHRNAAYPDQQLMLELEEESDGTIRILDLIEVLLNQEENRIFIVDELDRCLHPSLSYKFVESFLEIAKAKNVQLIVTTHESRLMDFALLRRDEIWFVDKEISGESKVYSLDEYSTRFDQRVDTAYLEGRFGGVPIFTNILPSGGQSV